MENENQHIYPFLKWVGGKRQLIKKFRDFYPPELFSGKVKGYCEPFLGGGAVFFDMINHYTFNHITICDINADLINVYNQVKTNVAELIEELSKIEISYLGKDEANRQAYYYKIRKRFNSNSSKNLLNHAADFIFLNRTCYNGLYRLNSKGEFNVPAGRYKNPKILDNDNLLKVSGVLQQVDIQTGSFDKLLKLESNEKMFLYFDPPYRPISKTANFTSYSKDVFTDNEQIKLFEVFKKLDKQGHFVMLSNSDPKNSNPNDNFFDDLYSDFVINRVPARRMVNSDPKKRGAINEIIVTNYPVKNE